MNNNHCLFIFIKTIRKAFCIYNNEKVFINETYDLLVNCRITVNISYILCNYHQWNSLNGLN